MTGRLKAGDPTYVQSWDNDNRLKSVTVNPTPLALRGLRGQTTTFTYDGNGALVKKVAGGVTTVYAGSHYEKQGGTVVRYYLYGGQRVAMNKDSAFAEPLAHGNRFDLRSGPRRRRTRRVAVRRATS